jgi:glycosyltransferase involved in cell wall biosynthesis
MLGDMSREALAPPGPRPAAIERERVLVVVTETYAVGGHTRTLWRWIARNPGRVHTLVTTAQRGVMPDGVRDAVHASGGDIVDLPIDAPARERAEALRALAADADRIVLIDHPHDPLPTLAFAGMPDRPPIVMMNHGDHLLWLGRSIVDVCMSLRPIGTELAARRGLPARRVITTPFPVSGPDDHGRAAHQPVSEDLRARARAALLGELGWPSDTVLLVTAGASYKYEGPEGHRLLDLIEPVLADWPQARLVAAGPTNEGRWEQLRDETGGRVAPLGSMPQGIGALHAAGDIYLESRPSGGPGAAAEAAAHGLPVLGYGATPLERSLFVTDAAYGTTCLPDLDEFRDTLARLIDDPALRAEMGEAARQAIGAADENWEAQVERTYALARELGPVGPSELSPLPPAGDVDELIDFSTPPGRRMPILHLERIALVVELIERVPGVRPLFGALDHTLRQTGTYHTAFAAPPADAEALQTVICEFRLLRDLNMASRFTIAVAPQDADVAVPILEAALADGSDIDVELALHPEPWQARTEGALDVTAPRAPGGLEPPLAA